MTKASAFTVCLALAALAGAGPAGAAARRAAVLPGQIVPDPANRRFHKYSGGGPFFMCGPGDPEGFLYRGTRNSSGTRSGDQMNLINKLKGTGANCIYMQILRSHGGDGPADHNPFVNSDPAQGLDQDILNQWETWFTEMDNNGIVIYLFFYDDSARVWNTGDSVGAAERSFIQAIVNKFEHHKHLIWCVAEEYQEAYSATRVRNIAAEIRAADDNDHVIAVHKLSGLTFSEFADDPNIDEFAIQTSGNSAPEFHSNMLTAWNNAAGKYALNMSEGHPDPVTGATSRRRSWACAMGGAYVMHLGMDIAGTSLADLQDCGRLVTFMQGTNFNVMSPSDGLKHGGTEYVLSLPGDSYIAYASALSGNIGLKGMTAGTYSFRWFDCVSGATVNQTNVNVAAGDQTWGRPGGIGTELAVWAKRTGGTSNTPPTANNQSLTVPHNTATSITLSYTDPDGPGPFAFTIVSLPANGTLSGSGQSRTYTPQSGYSGPDNFTWRVNDGLANSNTATVSITVQAPGNAPPVANSQSFSTPMNTPVTMILSYTDPDGPGPYTVTILSPPANGTLTGANNDRTYTPSAGFVGTDSFTWRVNDGLANSNTASVSLTVTSNTSIPAAPSNLSAQAVSPTQVNLSWTDNSGNETQFRIERSTGGGALSVTLKAYNGANTAPTVQAAGSANSFKAGALVVNDRTDTWTAVPASLSGATRLLTARNDRSQSPVDSKYVVTLSGGATIYLPLDPRYGGAKTSWMDGSWTDSGLSADSSAQTGWKIWKKTVSAAGDVSLGCDTASYDGVCYAFVGSGGFSQIATVGANVRTYSDTTVSGGASYSYRVRASNAAGDSPYSNTASVTTPSPGPDTDQDGLPDAWETSHFGNLSQTASGDPDNDTLSNLQEFNAGTDPTLADTDADGIPDAQEINSTLTDPTAADTDADGIPDGGEVAFGLDPRNGDQDANAVPDGQDDWNANGADNQTDVANGVPPGSPPAPVPSSSGGGDGGGCGLTGLEVLLLVFLRGRFRGVGSASLLVPLVCVSAASAHAQTVFPGADWQEATPASQGVDSAKLNDALSYYRSVCGSQGITQVAVVRNGYLIWKGTDIDNAHNVWSCSKSFTSTVLGLLIDDGNCALDTKAKDHVSTLAAQYPNVTLRHFATMTSGYDAVGGDQSSTPFDPTPPLFSPGTKYQYWDSAMNQFGNALTRIAREPIKDLFKRRIADKIGMRSTHWNWGDWGTVDGYRVHGGAGNKSKGISTSARDMARFGHLFLNRGKWGSQQLISAAWVDAATTPQVPSSVPVRTAGASGPGVYGYNWWVNGTMPGGNRIWPAAPPKTYMASGFNNNRCIVIPEWNMVVARLGTDGSTVDDAEMSTFLGKLGQAVSSSTSNAPPVAANQSVSVTHDTAKSITLGYSDPDGPGPYAFSIVQAPAHGTLGGSGQTRTYTPQSGYSGADSFTWRVNDGLANSNTATVSITVQLPGNTAPAAHDQSFSTPVGTPVAATLTYTDPDGPGPYTVTIVANPSHGTLSGTGVSRTYTPAAGFTGTDTFRWKVRDGLADSNTATATIAVTTGPDTDGDGMTDAFEQTHLFNHLDSDQDRNGTVDGQDDWDLDGTPNASDPSPGSAPAGSGAVASSGGSDGGCGLTGLELLLLLLLRPRMGLRGDGFGVTPSGRAS